MKLFLSSALKDALRLFKCFNNLAEKAEMAKPRCAELIGVPRFSMSHSPDLVSKCRVFAWTSRTRMESAHPSACFSMLPGMKISSMCRLFCFSRLTPWSRNLPDRKNDLAMFVENPSIRTPPTMPASINRVFL